MGIIGKQHSRAYGKQEIPTSLFRWRICALVALILCLLLLVGLLALGIILIQVTMDLQLQHRHLQLAWEDLKTNSSRRILNMKANLCLKGEKENTNSDLKCTLCPTSWHLFGATCYYISRGKKTWRESKKFCSLWNSTLLIPQEKSKNWVFPPKCQESGRMCLPVLFACL
ncbi:C-type lectin domain family 1 member B-like isoform X2 [Hemicordylus capensis]|uniref:C-type lectin domain family 1 member B-like isoform X2 n=1 Tax=Hemicordylus capensis TaxID=884348 RepID=UPI00230390ED|nr:C-type lectin domain family 1 member B-like isoform X2 [Hemicordylus capensis]